MKEATEATPMSDKGKIIGGLVVFLVLVTFPLWDTVVAGGDAVMPELEYPEGETSCVEDTEYMRAYHMDMLNDWRNALVREGETVYTSTSGQQYTMSLTGTCLDCHSDRDAFCTRCHDFSNVDPKCWDCHVDPRGN
jgi:hypothetical protein